MSEQDSDAAGWDSELDDVDLCCSSPSSTASTSSEAGKKPAGVSRARLVPSDFADAASTSAAQTAASRTCSDSSSTAANAAVSRSSSLSSMRPATSRVAANPGGPLFSLAVADLSSGNAGSSGGGGRTASFKQLGKPDAHGDSVLPALQQSAQPQIRPITTKIPVLPLRLSADNHGVVSSSSPFNSALASSDVAAPAAATAAAGLKPPSPTSLACRSSGSSSSLNDNQQFSRGRPGVRRASPSSHHAHRQGFGGASQQGAALRGNKPPPLSLFSTSTSPPGHSPHACAHTGAGANGGTAATSAGWAGVRSATEPRRGSCQAEPQQLVKVQLLLPALDVYLPLQASEAAPGAPTTSSSTRNPGSIQQDLSSGGSWSGRDGGLLQRSNSGGSSGAAAVGGRSISNIRGRSSFEGSLMAAGAYPAGEAEGQGGASRLIQDQHTGDSTTAAGDMLQNAISRALGVEASQLIYYATQHAQLSEVLQRQQQQPQQPQPARQHSRAHESISSAGAAAGGGSRPHSRGPSPLRGSNASSSKMGQTPSLPLPVQHQQPWSVVVGFTEGSCEFSLSRLEEILRCASAAGVDARLQESTKQLQEDLVRAKTRSMELTGDLARLQRAYNQLSQELNSNKLALLEAQSELAVAGDSFVKLEALHRAAGTTKGRRSQSNSPRRGQQQRSNSRGPPSARSHQHQEQQQQQQQSPLTKFAAAAATAAADATEQPLHPLHPPPAATAALAALTTSAGRAAGGSSLDYNDLVALMSRVASPGFLNFMQQFLLIYEQQSCCSAADLAAVAAAMAGNAAAGASSFHTSAVTTPRASRSSSAGRSRTPRQHLNRGAVGGGGAGSVMNGNVSTPAGQGMLAHLAKQLQQQPPQHCSPSSAHGAQSAAAAAVTMATSELIGGSSSGRRTGRRKGAPGRPAATPL